MREQFLAQLYDNLTQLQFELGNDWEPFCAELQKWLSQFLIEQDPDRREMCIDLICRAGLKTVASDLFRKIYFQRQDDPPNINSTSRLQSGEEVSLESSSTTNEHLVMVEIAQSILAKLPSSGVTIGNVYGNISGSIAGGDATINSESSSNTYTITGNHTTIKTGGDYVKGDKITAADEPPSPRYLQTPLTSDNPAEAMTATSPLALDGGPYILTVRIGPGEGDVPFPDDRLQKVFERESHLPIDVRVTSPDVDVTRLGDNATLSLPRAGNAEGAVVYRLSPRQTGRAQINVDAFYRGNLLQRHRLEVAVVARLGDPAPPSAMPPQLRRTVYTITADLSPEALAQWEARPLHLTVERREDQSFTLSLRQEGVDLAQGDTLVTAQSLGQLVDAVRAELLNASIAFGQPLSPEAKREKLVLWLPLLAYQGARLNQATLGCFSSQTPAGLPPRTTIQVSPIGPQATLPWGLVYDRPLEENWHDNEESLTNSLCPAWLGGHDCVDQGCPHADDADIVCPSGFWGYRYLIEQIPAGLQSPAPAQPANLPQLIDNCAATRFNLNGNAGLSQWEQEAQAYPPAGIGGGDGAFLLTIATDRPSFKTAMQAAVRGEALPHIIYFYAHGGKTPRKGPFLRLGSSDSGGSHDITLNMLDALRVRDGALKSHPLLFLNACESGDYGPDDYASFITAFYQAGACGLVGTECKITELTARAVANRFFTHFLSGQPAGEALWRTGRELLDMHNPLGLLYSLFAAGSTRLACPHPLQTEV